MNEPVLLDAWTHYPISDQARRRIENARVQVWVFDARRILAEGGFSSDEIDKIIEVVQPFIRLNQKIDREAVRAGLSARNFAEKEADSIASILAGT